MLSATQAATLIAARIPGNSVVLDTNIALDLLLFDDPACAPLAVALHAGRLRWLATAAMRAEFARVLAYPAIASRLALQGRDAVAVLAAFDALAHPAEPAAPAPCRCSDPDDQIFIDLAVAHRALLLSKDQAVLSMRKVLATLAVLAQGAINSIADERLPAVAPATGRHPYRGSYPAKPSQRNRVWRQFRHATGQLFTPA